MNTNQLPSAFVADMRETLGADEADRLCAALGDEPSVSVRLNPDKWPLVRRGAGEGAPTGKTVAVPGLARVPWCPTGFYLDQRPAFTFDPLMHAGAYYVQEASSMFVAHVLRQCLPECRRTCCSNGVVHMFNGDVHKFNADVNEFNGVVQSQARTADFAALDLCAAPGGKSTLLRAMLPEGALLVCNEPMSKRAAVLAENMTRWGSADVVVTQSLPSAFTALEGVFDVVLTDVPCSGEGMFRKDDEAIADWSPENVEMCWRRQRDILEAVWPSLKPGGLLVYSTCTYNRYEDEDNVRWIADTLGADVLPVEVDESWGVVPGLDGLGFHFFPGRTRGEGFYCAALRKRGSDIDAGTDSNFDLEPRTQKLKNSKTQTLKNSNSLRQRLRLLTHVVQDGVCMGEETKKGFVPSHALALTTATRTATDGTVEPLNADYPRHDVDYATAVAYLRGEALRLSPDVPRGYVIITYLGLPLGFVKNIGSRANNLYPDACRIRSTYTREFTLASL